MGRFGGGKAGRKIGGKAAVGLFRPALRWFKTAGVRTTVKRAAQATRRGLRKALSKPRNFAQRFRGRARAGDPIDIVSGEVVLQQTDIELDGVLPLVLERTHVSSYREGRWFGTSWASTLDQHLETDGDDVVFYSDDGMKLIYPMPVAAGTAIMPDEGPRLPLTRGSDGSYRITDRETGHTVHFSEPGSIGTMPATNGTAPVAIGNRSSAWPTGVLPLAAVTDRNGNRIDLVYQDGVPAEIRHSGGYRIGVRTEGGRITALRMLISDRDGQQSDPVLMRFGYDESGQLTEVSNSSDLPLRYTYSAEGRMTSWTDRNGYWYRYTYDEQGRGVRGTGKNGFLDAQLTYGDGYTIVTDSLRHRTTYEINALGQVVAETDPLGNTTRTEWDRYDRPLSVTDPLGNITHYTWDDNGNLSSITQPEGRRVIVESNELGLPVMVTEADGTVWRQAYDQRGNLISTIDPLGGTTRYTYNERGHLTSVTDPLGRTTTVECDPAGLLLAATDSAGAVSRWRRDSFGRVSEVIDPAGEATRFAWTTEGQLVSQRHPDGAQEHWSYDAEGNLISRTDPAGLVTRYEPGDFALMRAETGPNGERLEYSYDTEMRVVAVTNPQGLVWRYRYDAAGNLIGETDFNGREISYSRNAVGRLVSRVNAAGQETRYSHNALGEVIEEHISGEVATFSYDRAGRIVRARKPGVDLRIRYDPLGRMVAETINGRTIQSGYDPAGQRTSRTTPSGFASLWKYDAASRPMAATIGEAHFTFAYNSAGRETERRISNRLGHAPGVILSQQWDAVARLTSQTLWGAPRPAPNEAAPAAAEPRLLQHRAYAYRADGHVTTVSDQFTGIRRFGLDHAGRITGVDSGASTERYAYDATGNLTSATWPSGASIPAEAAFRPGPPIDLHEDAAGRREYSGTLLRRAGRIRYEHDAQGRVVLQQIKTLSGKTRTWRFSWNANDQLTDAHTPEGRHWHYLYDPLGRRIAKQRLDSDSETVLEQTEFAWDGTALAEQVTTTPAGIVVTSWDYEPETYRPLAQCERAFTSDAPQEWIDAQFRAIISDLTGTPVELVTPEGDLSWHGQFRVWGGALGQSGAENGCALRFPGQYLDRETGLHYNLHRYYDPATARYISPDPLGLTPQPNPHSYVRNPLTWADPLGLQPYKLSGPNPFARRDRRAIADEYEKIKAMRAAQRTGVRSPLGRPTARRYREDTEFDGHMYRAGDQIRHRADDVPPLQQATWRGAREWDVPGTDHRILELPDGRLGYALGHRYDSPQFFPGPWYMENGRIPRFLVR